MSASFRISQNSVDGSWDTSRQDLTLVGIGGTVTLEAQDQSCASYNWEVISEPTGSTAESSLNVPNPATPWIAELDLDVTGSILVRLRVDAALPTEDIRILFLGVPLPNSGLCIPAFNETDFDNSQGAATAGWERKLTAFYKWADNVSSGTASTPAYTYYVDALNGSDLTGTGAISNPFATLSAALTAIGQPINVGEFLAGITVVLRDGTYSNAVTIPTYANIVLELEGATISGDISWDLNPTYRYADVTAPTLVINGVTGLESVTGDIGVSNVFSAGGAITTKNLKLQNVGIEGHIVNNQTGSAAVASGELHVHIEGGGNTGASSSPSYRWGGIAETGGASGDNTLILHARDTKLGDTLLCGFSQVYEILNSLSPSVTPGINPLTGAPFYSGSIGNVNVATWPLSKGLINTSFVTSGNKNFGSSGTCYALRCDANTRIALSAALFSGSWTGGDTADPHFALLDGASGVYVDASGFGNSIPTTEDNLQTILDRVNTWDAYASDAVVRVSTGATEAESGANLLAGYTAAKALTPGGNALSATNRAVLLVPAGSFDITSTILAIDTNFVDIIGVGLCRDTAMTNSQISRVGRITFPDTVIKGENTDVVQLGSVTDIRVLSVNFQQKVNFSNVMQIIGNSNTPVAQFQDLGFSFASSVTTRGHGMYSAGGKRGGTWVECHSETAFHYGAQTRGYYKKCSGGNYSFGSSTTAAADCGGAGEDCVAGDYSFGASSSGAHNAKFEGTWTRCYAGDGSFGFTTLPSAVAQCMPTLCKECHAGDYSFGSSDVAPTAGSQLLSSGGYEDCSAGTYSFGGQGSSSGNYLKCSAGDNSFGGTSAFSVCSGSYDTCTAGDGSFGANGTVISVATFTRCHHTSAASPMLNHRSHFYDCNMRRYPNTGPVITAAAPTFTDWFTAYNTNFAPATGSTSSIDSYNGSSTVDVKLAHCRFEVAEPTVFLNNLWNIAYNASESGNVAYNTTYSSGSIAGSGGVHNHEFAVGAAVLTGDVQEYK